MPHVGVPLLLLVVVGLADAGKSLCLRCPHRSCRQMTAAPGARAECSCALVAPTALVCGGDGVTYLSRCLAECQGVSVAGEGACSATAAAAGAAAVAGEGDDAARAAAAPKGEPAAAASPARPSDDPITRATMDRFKSEGFRLVGAAADDAFAPELKSVQAPYSAAAAAVAEAPPALPAAPLTPRGALAVRKTADGLVYELSGEAASKQLRAAAAAAAALLGGDEPAAAKAVAAAFPLSAAARPPAGGGARRRRLAHIIGSDDRREMAGSPGWPMTAVGHLLFSKGACTGAVVGPRAVLTAAHCVYSRKRRAWQDRATFTPYRHRTSSESDTWPFGRVDYDYITTFTGFTEPDDYSDAVGYDLAVITLAKDIGGETGWFGMAWAPGKSSFTGTVYTAGYPGDKPFGSLWSASCRAEGGGEDSGSGAQFVTLCDAYAGDSGAPFWSKRDAGGPLLRAVNTYEACRCCSADCGCCSSKANGGNAIGAVEYAAIQAWRS
ncbi:MAG: trypsin-like cysteine/serine peptidase domain-containing protein [Monoraphidium minutum]|nr:MAG: trypsin-like cysteine/serine peptidase domain-containing protein [Monoraphidium minutum]